MKLWKIKDKEFFNSALKKQDFSTSTSEVCGNVYPLYLFHHLDFLFHVCTYVCTFKQLIKRRSKVHEKNMSRERVLHFDQ